MLIEELRKKVIEKARKGGIKDIENLSRFVGSCNDPKILKEILNKIPLLKRWYQSIKITYYRAGKPKVELYEKTPKEIGEILEGLVEIALRNLGCEVVPLGMFIRGKSGLPWVYDKKRKKWVLKLRTIGGLPSFKEEGKFKNRGIVFKRHPNVRDLVDFESEEIAIEVKNRDPAHPYRSKHLFKKDVLNRFKRVRKKKRYLLIPEGVLDNKQRKILKRRKIAEINIKEQLRRANQRVVYKSVFRVLKRVLSSCCNEASFYPIPPILFE